MKTTDEIKDLVAALSKAQGVIAGAVKDKENPFFKTNYADLSSVWEVARKPLSDNGLSVVQSPENSETGVKLVTRLYHSSGQFIQSIIEIPLQKKDAQAYGSVISYARRYSLAAMIGVYSEDDDGQSAGAEKADKKNVKQLLQKQPVSEWMTKLKNIKKDPKYKQAIKKLAKEKKFKPGTSEKEAQENFEMITSFKEPGKSDTKTDKDFF